MKTSSIRWHVLGWAAYLAYQVAGTYITAQSPNSLKYGLTLSLSQFGLYVVEFYLCYLLVFPYLLRQGRYLALTEALIGVATLFIGLRYGVEEVLFRAVLGFGNYSVDTTLDQYIFENFYYASPAIAASLAAWSARSALRRERENRQLTAEKQFAETAFLKSQINPHFLYNTLNLLYGMAYPVARPLAAAILQLADLMRYMLRDSPDGQVALAEEIEYLHNFLALYRLRFPDQFFVDFTVTGEPAGHRLAPLLLIPFVENAVKHGVLDAAAHPVRIHLTITPNALTFAVQNRVSNYEKDTSSGIGLTNLRRRLVLLYAGRHTLQAGVENGQFEARLRLTPPPNPTLL